MRSQSGIWAELHPDAFLPIQNKRQPAALSPIASYAAVQRAPAPPAHCQVYKLPRSALRRHKPVCPYNSIKDEHIGRSVKAKRKERTYDI